MEARLPVTDHRGAATPPVGHVLPTRSGTSHALQQPLSNARIGKGGAAVTRGIARTWGARRARVKKLRENRRSNKGTRGAEGVEWEPRWRIATRFTRGIERRVTAG